MFAEECGDDGKAMYGAISDQTRPAPVEGGLTGGRPLLTHALIEKVNLPALSRVAKRTIHVNKPPRLYHPDKARHPFKLPPKLLRQLDASTSSPCLPLN